MCNIKELNNNIKYFLNFIILFIIVRERNPSIFMFMQISIGIGSIIEMETNAQSIIFFKI